MTDMCKKALVSIGLVAFTSFLFPEILTIGESTFQSLTVFTFYIYCFISLFTYSHHKLFYVLSLPVLTQFIHIFQKYSFTGGANSLWRLLPFLILNLYLIFFFLKKKNIVTQRSRLFILSWLIVHAFFLLISPNLERIIWGGIILYLFTLPLFFLI